MKIQSVGMGNNYSICHSKVSFGVSIKNAKKAANKLFSNNGHFEVSQQDILAAKKEYWAKKNAQKAQRVAYNLEKKAAKALQRKLEIIQGWYNKLKKNNWQEPPKPSILGVA